ncbi:hypothetical protein IWW48_002014 [Coemansia sp. RSA 1200]|nr:hypothetical protein IWW48_002014 [Coemansia sp. RSA 1200]
MTYFEHIDSSFCAQLFQSDNALVKGLVVAGIWILAVMIKRSFLTSMRKIPGPLLNSFSNIIVNYHISCGSYHTYVNKLHSKYGEVVRIGYNQISVSSLDELKRILSTHDFLKGKMYESNGITAVSSFSAIDPEISKTKRRQIGNSYSLPTIRLYEDKILEHGVLSLMRSWDSQLALSKNKETMEKKTRVNFYYGYHGIAFDVIGILGYGASFNVIPSGDKTIIDQLRTTISLGILQTSLPLGNYTHRLFYNMVAARNHLVIRTANTIRKRRLENKAAESGGEKRAAREDILQRLITAYDPATGKMLDDEAVTAELQLMLAAGTDTTSNTLVWATLRMLHTPEVYNRLKDDIRTAFPDKSTVIRYDMARRSVPYLTAFIYEVMRLYPAVSGYLPRRAPTNGACMLGRYHVPYGAELCVSISACHLNPNVWSEPERFDPERFMGPDAEARIKDVLAFSAGVRICIGRFLGLFELYTTLANLIHKYDFELPADVKSRYRSVDDIPGSSFITLAPLHPAKDCWVLISPAT